MFLRAARRTRRTFCGENRTLSHPIPRMLKDGRPVEALTMGPGVSFECRW